MRQCLADVELRPPTACRLRSGTPALSIGIQIPHIEALLALRDRVLSGDFDRSVNAGLARGAPEPLSCMDPFFFLVSRGFFLRISSRNIRAI